MGQILKKQEKFKEAQEMYNMGGKFIKSYFDDEGYGKSKAENHPLMQQYYLLEFEWASACDQPNIEKLMLQKYVDIVHKNNLITGDDGTKPSLFMLEPKF